MPNCGDHHVHNDIAGPDRYRDFPCSHFIDSHRDKQRHQEWVGEHGEQKYPDRAAAVDYFHKTWQLDPAQKAADGIRVDFICRVGKIDIRHKMLACARCIIDQHSADCRPGGSNHADQERVKPAAEGKSQRKTRGWDWQRGTGQDGGEK